MKRKLFCLLVLAILLSTTCSCSLFRPILDRRTGLTKYLKETETYIRDEEWGSAMASLKKAEGAWKKIRPIMQIDIDHDYVNQIQECFALLKGNIETQEKPGSLSTVILIREILADISAM